MNYLPGSGAMCVWCLGVQEQLPEPVATVMDTAFPWARCPTRLRNAFGELSNPPQTFGEMLRFGRFRVHLIPRLGEISLNQLDELMEQYGIGELWNNS